MEEKKKKVDEVFEMKHGDSETASQKVLD